MDTSNHDDGYESCTDSEEEEEEMIVEIVMAFEEEFSFEIPDNEAEKIDSIKSAVDFIASHPQTNSQGKFRINSPFVLMETETVVEILPETSLTETETVVETLPELPLDVLMYIFALLEIPDLIRAGSVCSF
ncbi:Tryptophan aminotransferase 1 [Hordeum vulgare]|nr:Tryptophan aminotransferase 1 [Hordeum vulgare]